MKSTCEQISIFDYMEDKSNPICTGCVFYQDDRCSHIIGEDFGCEYGSFRIPWQEAVCPECGETLTVRQMKLGCDYAICRRCKRNISFNNMGNRKTAFQLWKTGKR